MVKKLLATVLSVIMLSGMGTTVFAADAAVLSENEVNKAMPVDELIEQLKSIDFGMDVTFTALSQSRSNDQALQEFDSIEDAETYLKGFMAESRVPAMSTGSYAQNSIQEQIATNVLTSSSAGWYNGTVWWWGGGNTSLLSLTNAEVGFYYNGVGTMSNISVNNSYMTGIVGATWEHRSGSATALGGMDAKYSVTGTWFIGLEIYGFPVGASFNETLTSPTITMEME
jgi:hypothetical protein